MPVMKVSGDSEAEGEPEGGDAESVSGGDTERSGGSSRPDRDSSAEEADEPDSDDSSEMDESECERRRNDCLENIADMERQFIVLREQLFRERINQVDYQLAEVRGGRSQEYLGPLLQLQENMRTRIEVAGVLRQLRIENVKHHCEAEELAALQNLNLAPLVAADGRSDGASRVLSVRNKMAADTVAIIQAIEKHPSIWNLPSEEYRDKLLKEKAWKSVCEEVVPGWSEMSKAEMFEKNTDIKKKWANVRDYFKIVMKTKRRKYIYSDLLTFMNPILSKKSSAGSGEEEDSNAVEYLETHTDDECTVVYDIDPNVAVKAESADPMHYAEISDDSLPMCASGPATADYPTTSAKKKIKRNNSKMKLNHFEISLLEALEKERTVVGAEDEDLGFFRCLLPDIKKLNDGQKFDFKLGTMKLLKKIKSKNVPDPDSSDQEV